MDPAKIFFIINPASGLPIPILSMINQAFRDSKIGWHACVTTFPGEEIDCVKEAVSSNAAAVAVYGGDGTVTAVVKALYGKKIPLIILPGGTANIFAASIGVPKDLPLVLSAIAANKLTIKKIDMGLNNGEPLLTAITTGLLAKNVQETTVAEKNQVGEIAYYINTLRILSNIESAKFTLIIEDNRIEFQAITLIIANSGQFSTAGIALMAGQDNTDGKLDILAIHTASPATLINAVRIQQEIVSDSVSFWRTSHATLKVPKGVPILVDDFPVATPASFNLSVDPLAVEFLIPQI